MTNHTAVRYLKAGDQLIEEESGTIINILAIEPALMGQPVGTYWTDAYTIITKGPMPGYFTLTLRAEKQTMKFYINWPEDHIVCASFPERNK